MTINADRDDIPIEGESTSGDHVIDDRDESPSVPPLEAGDSGDDISEDVSESEEGLTEAGDEAGDAPDAGDGENQPVDKSDSGPGVVDLLRKSFSISGLRELWQQAAVWKIAIAAVVVYALTVNAGYFLLLKPNSDRLRGVKETKELLHDFNVIEECSAAMSSFQDGLMNGDQRLTVMSEVQLMATEAGVKVIGDPDLLSPRDVSSVVKEYPVRLRVSGGYHEVGRFVSLLERSPRFIQIEEIEIISEVASRSLNSEATVTLALASWEE